MSDPQLSVKDLSVTYHTKYNDIIAVDHVSFQIKSGEILGIVGESGCGKSTLASTILHLLDENGEITSGEIHYDNMTLATMSERDLSQKIRGKQISMVFQDPTSSLDPVYTIGRQMIETIRQHFDVTKKEARQRAINSLADVGIPSPEDRLDDYPHQYSGGMQQRVVIAIALSCEPGLLIADEPTTGLDVSIQAQILTLLANINETHDTAVLLITHDLSVITSLCDRVGVMYAGNLVEISTVETLYDNPKHPYTQDLLQSIPENHAVKEDLSVIDGQPPDLRSPPPGCRYHPRCSKMDQVCGDVCKTGSIPPNYKEDDSEVRCYLFDPDKNSTTTPRSRSPREMTETEETDNGDTVATETGPDRKHD